MTTQQHFLLPDSWLSRRVRLAVIGAGGTGSELVDVLSRLHGMLVALGHPCGLELHLIDDDVVSTSNVGRQRFLAADVGQPKAVVLARRYSALLGVPITPHVSRVTRANERQELGKDFDLVITAVDSAKMRVKLARHWANKATDALWLDCGNAAHDGQICVGHLGRPQKAAFRLPNAWDLFVSLDTALDDDTPSCSVAESIRRQAFGVNRWVATLAMTLLWNLFRQGRLDHHGAFFDTLLMQSRPLPIDPAQWAGLGYDSEAGVNLHRAKRPLKEVA